MLSSIFFNLVFRVSLFICIAVLLFGKHSSIWRRWHTKIQIACARLKSIFTFHRTRFLMCRGVFTLRSSLLLIWKPVIDLWVIDCRHGPFQNFNYLIWIFKILNFCVKFFQTFESTNSNRQLQFRRIGCLYLVYRCLLASLISQFLLLVSVWLAVKFCVRERNSMWENEA